MWNLAAKVFGGIGVMALLFSAGHWAWFNPQKWNGIAKQHYRHSLKLSADSTRWHGDSLALRDTLFVRDALIAIQKREWNKALEYGNQYKAQYTQQVAEADAVADRLTDRETELAYYYALQKSGALPPTGVPLELLKPNQPDVLRAGLKTADREAIGRSVIDSLGRTLGLLKTKTERLGAGLKTATSGLSKLSKKATAMGKTGGIWPFNSRRRQEEQQISQSLDSLSVEVSKVSALEVQLNTKP